MECNCEIVVWDVEHGAHHVHASPAKSGVAANDVRIVGRYAVEGAVADSERMIRRDAVAPSAIRACRAAATTCTPLTRFCRAAGFNRKRSMIVATLVGVPTYVGRAAVPQRCAHVGGDAFETIVGTGETCISFDAIIAKKVRFVGIGPTYAYGGRGPVVVDSVRTAVALALREIEWRAARPTHPNPACARAHRVRRKNRCARITIVERGTPATCHDRRDERYARRYGVHLPPPGRLATMAAQSGSGKHIPMESAIACAPGCTTYVKHDSPPKQM